MANEKRERQKAQREARLAAEKKAATASQRKKFFIKWGGIVGGILVAAFLYSQFFGEDDPNDTADDGAAAVEPADARFEVLADLPAGCPAADGSSPTTSQFDGPPPTCIDPELDYVAEFTTSAGNFTALLRPEDDVASVNNFIFLARHHAYDGTVFHRVINNFMIQGGDVEDLSGQGGPGYSFRGEFAKDDSYLVGTLAMANRGDPSSNGSQFFIVTGDAGVNLDPLYSPLGQVISGIDVPLEVQGVDTEPGDAPTSDVTIETVFIRLATEDDLVAYDEVVG